MVRTSTLFPFYKEGFDPPEPSSSWLGWFNLARDSFLLPPWGVWSHVSVPMWGTLLSDPYHRQTVETFTPPAPNETHAYLSAVLCKYPSPTLRGPISCSIGPNMISPSRRVGLHGNLLTCVLEQARQTGPHFPPQRYLSLHVFRKPCMQLAVHPE